MITRDDLGHSNHCNLYTAQTAIAGLYAPTALNAVYAPAAPGPTSARFATMNGLRRRMRNVMNGSTTIIVRGLY